MKDVQLGEQGHCAEWQAWAWRKNHVGFEIQVTHQRGKFVTANLDKQWMWSVLRTGAGEIYHLYQEGYARTLFDAMSAGIEAAETQAKAVRAEFGGKE